jgi:lipoprotein-releasing system permease protein
VAGRRLGYGWLPGVALLWGLLPLGQGVALLALQLPEWPVVLMPSSLGLSGLVSLFLGVAVVRQTRRMDPGLDGRGRITGFGFLLGLRGLSDLALAAILAAPILFGDFGGLAPPDPIAFDLGIERDPRLELQLELSRLGLWSPMLVALVLGRAAAIGFVGTGLSLWFVLPVGFRRAVWFVFDGVLAVGFVAATVLFPLTPPEGAAPWPAGIRLGLTTVAVLRLVFRLLPTVLDGVELAGFQARVAARMMRAKKSGFLTTIGALSILAVCFSSCTLTTVLSVMGGFRNDLKEKILGNNAHVVVDREYGTFEGWAPVLQAVRETDGVVAASPYAQGEVMVTSATNLSGAVLRGIDPETVGEVTDLPRNLTHGDLSYLSHPERLLDLSVEEMSRNLLRADGPATREGEEEDERGPRTRVLDDLAAAIDDADREATARDGLRQDLEPFLRDEGEAAPGEVPGPSEVLPEPTDDLGLPDFDDELPPEFAAGVDGEAEERDVIPGIIVGQELARSLRLHLGDEVQVVSPLGDLGPAGPMPRTRPFRVAGIFYSGMYEYDMKVAYTSLDAAQRFLNLGVGIHGIEAKVDDFEMAGVTAEAVAAALRDGGRDDLRVRAWQEVNRNLFGALALEKLAMFVLLGIAILVASFCIVSTLILLVQEKGKEVGILKAMGATSQQIIAVFLVMGLMIGLLGASLGVGLGYVTCFVMEHFGVRLNPEVYYIDRLPVHIDTMEFGQVWVAAVIVCLLATIYPAILGSRLRPLDALRDG